MKNQGMSWSLQGIRRMLWLRINIREGTLANSLRSCRSETIPITMPEKQIQKVIDHTIKHDYSNYFNVGVPAISGPHASRYLAEILKSLTRIAL